MRIHYLQHVPFEDLANISFWCKEKGYSITCSQLYNDTILPGNEDFDWLIVMGGPMNIYEEKKYPWLLQEKKFIEKAIMDNKTVLGICLGAQLIADVLGAAVRENKYKEIGWFPVNLKEEIIGSENTYSLPERFIAFHWHQDTFDIPCGCKSIAVSEACEHQAFEYNDRVLGLQFHLESSVDSVKKLITNCSDELIEDKYVQSSKHIMLQDKYFQDIHTNMKLLLDNLEQKSII